MVFGVTIAQDFRLMPWWQIYLYGDMPFWAQSYRVHEAMRNGRALNLSRSTHWLAEVLGCVTDEVLQPLETVQCGEVFVYVRPLGELGRVLASIVNIQVSGYVQEARGYHSQVGTAGGGRVERAVLYDGFCYGNVEECVSLRAHTIEFTNGWKLRASAEGLQLVSVDGTISTLGKR